MEFQVLKFSDLQKYKKDNPSNLTIPGVSVFKAGDFRAAGKGIFTKKDLKDMESNFKKLQKSGELAALPINAGHFRNNNGRPMLGWIETGVKLKGDTLFADFTITSEPILDLFKNKGFRFRSAEIHDKEWPFHHNDGSATPNVLAGVGMVGIPQVPNLGDIDMSMFANDGTQLMFDDEERKTTIISFESEDGALDGDLTPTDKPIDPPADGKDDKGGDDDGKSGDPEGDGKGGDKGGDGKPPADGGEPTPEPEGSGKEDPPEGDGEPEPEGGDGKPAGHQSDVIPKWFETGVPDGCQFLNMTQDEWKEFEGDYAVLTPKQRKALPASAFCGPGRTFPVPDCVHYSNALSRLGSTKVTGTALKKIEMCILRKGVKLGCKGAKDRLAAAQGKSKNNSASGSGGPGEPEYIIPGTGKQVHNPEVEKMKFRVNDYGKEETIKDRVKAMSAEDTQKAQIDAELKRIEADKKEAGIKIDQFIKDGKLTPAQKEHAEILLGPMFSDADTASVEFGKDKDGKEMGTKTVAQLVGELIEAGSKKVDFKETSKGGTDDVGDPEKDTFEKARDTAVEINNALNRAHGKEPEKK